MYQYKCPTENGYRRMKLSRRDHNRIFTKRKRNILNTWEYYANEKEIQLHNFTSPLGVIVITLLLPFVVFVEGIPRTVREYKGYFNQKKKGRFCRDNCTSASPLYAQFMEVAKEK